MKKTAYLILLSLLLSLFSVSAQASLSVERQVYEYLTKELGLPSSSACGILANIEQESAFDPNAVGDQGTSYGLCQWHDGRFSKLKSHCLARGLDYRSVEGQMDYLSIELRSTYYDLLAVLRNMEDTPEGAYRAGYLWCVEFERPADMERKGAARGTLAQGKYWNRYNGFVMVQPEEAPPTDEEVREYFSNSEVVIPQPPENSTVQRYEDQDKVVLQLRPYVPRHRPSRVQKADPASGVAMGILFMVLSDGRKYGWQLPEPEECGELPDEGPGRLPGGPHVHPSPIRRGKF